MRKLHVLIILVIFTGCESKIIEPAELAKKYKAKHENHTSISYDIDYKMKYFSEIDTLDISATIDLIRSSEDTIFGSYLWIKTQDSIRKIL